eukprot:2072816-Alexandrium_andersonii.AAC.1
MVRQADRSVAQTAPCVARAQREREREVRELGAAHFQWGRDEQLDCAIPQSAGVQNVFGVLLPAPFAQRQRR